MAFTILGVFIAEGEKIIVESKVGEGSTFQVTLPRYASQAINLSTFRSFVCKTGVVHVVGLRRLQQPPNNKLCPHVRGEMQLFDRS
ncbi:hypothetical protein KSZ_05470 [Dictyobacter formicarum]|uniref:Histidine kinase/HSP90-like ATPase domain-containing protein n=1 Tax=Dictyobacter formicarum TaxID=2778368 RepID=A0ABQ3VAN3_9CHLR|nr:hypothetical protein KSZ_05470 [Dictyobacter formicarum]